MQTLADWLVTFPAVDCAESVSIGIGKQTYDGAMYVERHDTGEVTSCLYLLGDLPASYKRSSKTCYRFEGDSRDWYVAGYATRETIAKSQNGDKFHPFGPAIFLRPWSVPNGQAIDVYEEKPYTRVIATKK